LTERKQILRLNFHFYECSVCILGESAFIAVKKIKEYRGSPGVPVALNFKNSRVFPAKLQPRGRLFLISTPQSHLLLLFLQTNWH